MKKRISIIKEKIFGEKRVIFLPEHVKEFVKHDYEVCVEKNAGSEIGISDNEYEKAGARIVDTNTAWTYSNLIFKYKAPIEDEYKYFHDNLTIAGIMHAEGDKRLVDELCKAGVTAYSYEFFKTDDDIFPLAIPGGEIAGKVGFLYAMYFLQARFGGSGNLLVDIVGVKKPKVVVIGYGNVGNAVIQMAHSLGNEVVVFGTNEAKLRKYHATLGSDVKCMVMSEENLMREIKDADAVFGAILISTYDTEAIVTKKIVSNMKKGAILVDITCGYGSGYMPTFKKSTTLQKPVYEEDGILYCKINNLPAAYPNTTAKAYAKNAFPYLLNLAEAYYDKSVIDKTSENGKIIEKGSVVHNVIKQHIEFYESKIYNI